MYKVFINPLLKKLNTSSAGYSLGAIFVGSPTCADDILLAANSVSDLQVMLQQASVYASQHRYVLHPEKSTVLIMNSKTPLHVWREVKPFRLGDAPLQIATDCTHLGLLRSTNSSNRTLVEERLKLARRTTYMLMGAGVHGRNGINPITSNKLLNIYVLPRYLHDIETINLNITEMKLMSNQHRKVLKQIQHLPDRIPEEAVYYFLGQLPIDAVLDQRRLNLFGSICRGDAIEHEIAVHQLANKDINSNSWFIRTAVVLAKYSLGDAHSLLEKPPSKEIWKKMVKEAIESYWANKLCRQAATKSSLRYINWDPVNFFRPHHIWSSLECNHLEVRRATIKCKLTTGTYVLQTNRAKFNKADINTTCPLCNNHPEDRSHFILACEVLTETRKSYLEDLKECFTYHFDANLWNEMSANQDDLLQLILDCTNCHRVSSQLDERVVNELESISRKLCYALHKHRTRVLSSVLSSAD